MKPYDLGGSHDQYVDLAGDKQKIYLPIVNLQILALGENKQKTTVRH